ncbi:uncharacterized protein cubi_01076 [Cryptosporidium ubiquitum]|uniref:Uncharacterized protein n=1 Tax=Cryptosporidium ubiquitum TaxID=857276 RepID=A0A1J4MJ32_9CRYT|nr:uncharacterized protein cubi_01076 [Cryptosporidium ubiquitum]OII74232.1 hypothetical protein cubi_01076 [Cryptosporidium ubiquitum]
MNAYTEVFQANNLDLAKQFLSEDYEISGELFWSLLFWKMPELFFLSVCKSTQISRELLSNSLNKMISNDFDNTFDSIILILAKLSDLLEIQAVKPNESYSPNIAVPNLQKIVFLYSTIIYTIFPYINEELCSRESQKIQLLSILNKTKKTISNFNLIYKDFDRIIKKVSQLNEIKYGLLKGVLSGITNQITQVPIIQQLTLE